MQIASTSDPELDAAGRILGRGVVLGLADDYCDAEQRLAAARKLGADGVGVVNGHLLLGFGSPRLVLRGQLGPLIALAANPLLADGDFV